MSGTPHHGGTGSHFQQKLNLRSCTFTNFLKDLRLEVGPCSPTLLVEEAKRIWCLMSTSEKIPYLETPDKNTQNKNWRKLVNKRLFQKLSNNKKVGYGKKPKQKVVRKNKLAKNGAKLKRHDKEDASKSKMRDVVKSEEILTEQCEK